MNELDVIQADEPADDEEVKDSEVEEVEDTGVSEPEAEDDTTESKGDESTDDDDYEPFIHEVKYKANGKEEVFRLQYDKEGNLTSDTMANLTQVLAKTGLERTAQEKAEYAKAAEKRAQVAEAKAAHFQKQIEELQTSYQQPAEFIRKNPAVYNALRSKGMPEFPDPERLKFQLEKQEFEAEKSVRAQEEFANKLNRTFLERHPELNMEHLDVIVSRMKSDETVINAIPKNADPDTLYNVLIALTEATYKGLMLEGKFPNPALEKAKADKAATDKKIAKVQDTAKKRAAVRNPLAGGRSGVAGKGKSVPDMSGWSPRDYVIWQTTGKTPDD